MPKAESKNTPRAAADKSIALGLDWWRAVVEYANKQSAADKLADEVWAKNPPPPEILHPQAGVTYGNSATIDKCDIDRISDPDRRRRLSKMITDYKVAMRDAEREAGVPQAEFEADRLSRTEHALYILWLNNPATSVRGLCLKLRAWRYYANLTEVTDPDAADRSLLSVLADAERMSGVSITPPAVEVAGPAYAELTIREFGEPAGAAA